MIYTGIDHHKRYSVACTLDAKGRRLLERRIDHNSPEAFAAYFAALGEPSEVAIEACWNWATLYDLLEETPGVAIRRGRADFCEFWTGLTFLVSPRSQYGSKIENPIPRSHLPRDQPGQLPA